MDLLASLGRYEHRFRAALDLFLAVRAETWDLIREADPMLEPKQNTLSSWTNMAAREGAMSIYHFGCAAAAIAASLNTCPTLQSKIDVDAIGGARNLFEAKFPSYISMRNAIAHVAEFSGTVTQSLRHSIKGPLKFIFGQVAAEVQDKGNYRMEDDLYDTTYCIMYMGRAYSYELSLGSASSLKSVRERIYAAFDATT